MIKRIVIALPIILLLLYVAERYKSYNDLDFDLNFFEEATNQNLSTDNKIQLIKKEDFISFLGWEIRREFIITNLSQTKLNGWKAQPNKNFKKGETNTWERIIDHTDRYGQ